MWIKPAVAGAVIVTGLALGVAAGGASPPEDTTSTVQVDQAGRDHDKGRKRGHDRDEKDQKSGRPDKAEKPGKPGKHREPGPRGLPEGAPNGNGPPPHVTLRPGHPRHGEACVRPARYEGGPLEACPWMRVEGRIVPAEPRPHSESDE